MSFISRRTFLILLATGGFAGLATKLLLRNSSSTPQNKHPSALIRHASPGPLSVAHLNILLAMVTAVTQQQTLQGNYEGYFKWRSENMKDYRIRYEDYCGLLNQTSIEMTKRTFLDNPPALRLKIINSLRTYLNGKPDPRRFDSREKRLFEFETLIVQETLQLFARTDALLAPGYNSFPGQARGFDSYRKLPA
jgi:hypothetical protein